MAINPSLVREAHESFRSIRCDDQGNLCVVPPISGLPTQKFLTTAGDGTGAYNHIGDFSGASPTDIYYQVQSGEYYIYSVCLTISGAAKFLQPNYGTLAALTNGITFFVEIDGTEYPLLSGFSVKHNYDWPILTAHYSITDFSGLAQTMISEFRMIEDYGEPLYLGNGDKFIVRLQDNFTGLVAHTYGLRGIKT